MNRLATLPIVNLSQQREELDWQENQAAYLASQAGAAPKPRLRDLIEYAIVLGLLGAAVSACFVLRIGE
ncbi:MAG: hypothetical protein KGL35_12060 [Bradyrhizobium sp.]|nr:hypothetical protein [Bradyrhizobium sp.]